MPRKYEPICPESPYHVTGRSNNREFFPLPMPELWTIFEDQIYFCKHAFNLKIYSFVLMNNHFHLVIRAPDNNLGAALNFMLTEISREIGRRTKTRNHQFGGKNFKCRIGTLEYFRNAYKYIYRNPVQANIASRVEEYPYSTLRGKIGLSRLGILVESDIFLETNFEDTLDWLNTPSDPEVWESVGKALRKSEFKMPRKKNGYGSEGSSL